MKKIGQLDWKSKAKLWFMKSQKRMQLEFIYLNIMFQPNTYHARKKDKYYKFYLEVSNGASMLILMRHVKPH